MRSRGFLFELGAGTRRGLVLLWTALLLSSLVLQYVAAPAAVLAVHDEGLFELDGNATDGAAAGDDWNSTNNAEATVFIPGSKENAANDTTYFTSGGSKDVNDISQWKYTANDVSPDKDEILDAYAAAYEKGGDTFVYFGADRFDGSGDAFIGFWFVQNKVGLDGNGDFNGVHHDGDILVVSDFTNGGSVSKIDVYEWLNGDLKLKTSGAECDLGGSEDACAMVNGDQTPSPWPFLNKTGSNDFAAGEFYEGGINLDTVFGGDAPCFSSFLAETRSSQSTTAQLKDFALGSFNTCKPPNIDTQVSKASVDFGGTVTDTATLSGNDGPVTGSVKFYLCGPESSAPDCSTGGTQIGDAVAISGGSATSDAYTVGLTAAASGRYCWRAAYVPDSASQYLAGSHTNLTTECFKVDPATIKITKTASPVGPVNAGEQIGFDITVSNEGTQTTLGVNASDTLPAGIAWTADAPTGSTAGLSCSIASGVLTCTKPSLAAGSSFTVHVHGMTDAADCGTVENTARVDTSNDGSDTAKASVVVTCPDITVTKTADGASVNAGDPIGFTVTITNKGDGTATGTHVTDTLPAGFAWTIESQTPADAWKIDGGSLSFGPASLAAGASATVHIVAATSAELCKVVPNEASVTWTNEGSAKADDTTEVLCPDITITKKADAASVSAGDPIGFTVTITNKGDGTATGTHVTDTLPAGFAWTIESQTPADAWKIDGGSLSFGPASLAAGASATVHIVAATSAELCKVVPNEASVTWTNEGSAKADDTTEVLCPDITITKKADAASVSAGDPIGFTVTITNKGDGTATGTHVTDTLPAGFAWTIESQTPADAWKIDGGSLSFGPASLAAGASATVHIVAATSAELCKVVPNEASVTWTNEGSAKADDTTEVLCPDIHVEKAGNGPLSAGDTATFTIKVSNDGDGRADEVVLTDDLPDGIDWYTQTAGCSIEPATATVDQVLTCNLGTISAHTSRTITVSGDTVATSCPGISNTASATASNESDEDAADNSGSGSIVVSCPAIVITKTTVTPVVSATDAISFDIEVTNTGAGTAYAVTVSDTLPTVAGLSLVDRRGKHHGLLDHQQRSPDVRPGRPCLQGKRQGPHRQRHDGCQLRHCPQRCRPDVPGRHGLRRKGPGHRVPGRDDQQDG